jgi:RimJ/RimL family protein N-acetyltransferase
MNLETDRLLLQRWDARHLRDFVSLMSDERAMRYVGSGAIWNREESEERFAWHLEHWRRHGFGWRFAREKSSGALVGCAGISHVRPEAIELGPDDVEIGGRLAPSATGRGFATEAAVALRDEGFGRVGLDLLVGRCQPGNAASARVMEKIGMRFERLAQGRHCEQVAIYNLERGRWSKLRADSADPT